MLPAGPTCAPDPKPFAAHSTTLATPLPHFHAPAGGHELTMAGSEGPTPRPSSRFGLLCSPEAPTFYPCSLKSLQARPTEACLFPSPTPGKHLHFGLPTCLATYPLRPLYHVLLKGVRLSNSSLLWNLCPPKSMSNPNPPVGWHLEVWPFGGRPVHEGDPVIGSVPLQAAAWQLEPLRARGRGEKAASLARTRASPAPTCVLPLGFQPPDLEDVASLSEPQPVVLLWPPCCLRRPV